MSSNKRMPRTSKSTRFKQDDVPNNLKEKLYIMWNDDDNSSVADPDATDQDDIRNEYCTLEARVEIVQASR